MKRQSWRQFLFLFGLIGTAMLKAEPLVPGYARFHSNEPTLESGALLYSELGCANCHGESPVAVARQGPVLRDLKQRVGHDWLVSFLVDPEGARPGSTMPRMLHGLSAQEVESVAAFLGSERDGIRFNNGRHANAERGHALYHEKGCVACHSPTLDVPSDRGTEGVQVPLAVPFPNFKQKTSLEALNHFLLDPARYRPDGRMPHLVLDRQESMDVAAHLMDFQASDPGEADSVKPWPKHEASLIQEGRALVRKLNCVACHEIPGETKRKLKPLSDSPYQIDSGCLSTKAAEGRPYFTLGENQRGSLVKYLGGRKKDDRIMTSTTLKALNCYACHERDEVGGPTVLNDQFFVGEKDLGDAGRLPPPLTGIGFKLKSKWLRKVLRGEPGTKVRSYLSTRMPRYHSQAESLAQMLEESDARDHSFPVSHSPEILAAGRILLGTQGGVNCITCHSWGERPSLGIQALDISSLDQRLRPEWFHQYLLNPVSYRPDTLMPALWPEGKSTIPGVLEGRTDQQIAAIWSFIEKGKEVPMGFPNHREGKFELVPKERPIIQRTFMKGAGTKAILVGFPGGVNLAYDGSGGFPSLIWKGRFFDAYQTWFSRMAPFEEPLGESLLKFPPPKGQRRFLGYRLDSSGDPIFLLRSEERAVEETISARDGKLIRILSWKVGGPPEVTHPEGATVTREIGKNKLTLIYAWE